MDRIITISRQFGSGGKLIADIIGKRLGIPVLDKEIIRRAADDSGIGVEHFEKADERRTSSFLFSLVSAHYGPQTSVEMPGVFSDDNLFMFTASAIKKLVTGPCVVVGRCADDTLSELNPFKAYITAELSDRIARVSERFGLSEKEAGALTKKTDKARAAYYNFYTGKTWGEPTNYDIILNTSVMGVEKAADIIIKTLQ